MEDRTTLRDIAQRPVELPEDVGMLQRLTDAGIIGSTGDRVDSFYQDLIVKLSGGKNIMGVNMAWQSAIFQLYESEPDYPKEMKIIISGIELSFNSVVESLIDDSELAEEIKGFRQKFLDTQHEHDKESA